MRYKNLNLMKLDRGSIYNPSLYRKKLITLVNSSMPPLNRTNMYFSTRWTYAHKHTRTHTIPLVYVCVCAYVCTSCGVRFIRMCGRSVPPCAESWSIVWARSFASFLLWMGVCVGSSFENGGLKCQVLPAQVFFCEPGVFISPRDVTGMWLLGCWRLLLLPCLLTVRD